MVSDNTFKSRVRDNMCEWESPKTYDTVEEAVEYMFICYKNIEDTFGLAYETTDGKVIPAVKNRNEKL